MSSNLDTLLDKINKHKVEYEEREKTEVGRLINRILSGKSSEEYWLKLSQDIKKFWHTYMHVSKKVRDPIWNTSKRILR